jgi:hypothetical protein
LERVTFSGGGDYVRREALQALLKLPALKALWVPVMWFTLDDGAREMNEFRLALPQEGAKTEFFGLAPWKEQKYTAILDDDESKTFLRWERN